MKEFKWTDELVKEFAKTFDACDMGIHQFKQLKSEQKHYEILSVRSSAGDGWSCDKSKFEWYLNNGWTISQVKRLSDNEIFSIGDKIVLGSDKIESISKIEINDRYGYGVELVCETTSHSLLGATKISKQPLFTTTDGVDIFEGDEYWFTHGEEVLYEICANKYIPTNPECKFFSTEEAAKEYIIMNQLCLSLKDVAEIAFNMQPLIFKNSPLYLKLQELVKEKINL